MDVSDVSGVESYGFVCAGTGYPAGAERGRAGGGRQRVDRGAPSHSRHSRLDLGLDGEKVGWESS